MGSNFRSGVSLVVVQIDDVLVVLGQRQNGVQHVVSRFRPLLGQGRVIVYVLIFTPPLFQGVLAEVRRRDNEPRLFVALVCKRLSVGHQPQEGLLGHILCFRGVFHVCIADTVNGVYLAVIDFHDFFVGAQQSRHLPSPPLR